jgi:hypothetical protein
MEYLLLQKPTAPQLIRKFPQYCEIRNIHWYTQNYWIFGLFPSSGILVNRKHDVSETDPVSETLFSSL